MDITLTEKEYSKRELRYSFRKRGKNIFSEEFLKCTQPIR